MGHPKRKPLADTEFTAEVIDLGQDGRGFARVDGKAVFIDGALPGERVRFRLTRQTRDIDDGVMTAVEQASPDRVTPRCAHFGVCGGCALQHLAPAAQLLFKQKQLVDALTRLGGVTPEQIAPPVTGPVWAYRRRARLGVKLVPKKGGVLVGFRERSSPLLAKIDRCEVLDARVGERIEALAALIGRLSIADALPQIELAMADHVALVIRVLREPSAADLEALRAFALEQDFDIHLQRGGPDSVRPLGASRVLHYAPLAPVGDEPPLNLMFGPMDFVQVNGVLSQRMVQQALDWLAPQPGEKVLELFAGLGNFTAPLAASGAQVTAVEGETALVEKGRANLERNGLSARYFKADLFVPNAQAAWLRESYDAALLDPPRSGAAEVIPHVAASGARRIVYVSCHPGTLARDAGLLVKTHGYRLLKAGVLDMFPHTAHVESMALFVKP
jgi:23S rRNA (uracil1939-C5)-methyltransferase